MLPKICSIPECGKSLYAAGLCGTHYRASKPACEIDECSKPIHAKGFCGTHYRRLQRRGDVNSTSRIVGNDFARFWAKVKKTSNCWEWTDSLGRHGYGNFRLGAREYKAHRVSYEIAHGSIPEGAEIDHRCHNRACVNPEHLRTVTRKQNMENLSGAPRNSRIGIRGVSKIVASGKWRARIGHNGKGIHVGMFGSAEEANAAVIAKRNELFTHNDLDRS